MFTPQDFARVELIRRAVKDGTLDQLTYNYMRNLNYDDEYLVKYINSLHKENTTSIARLKEIGMKPEDLSIETLMPPQLSYALAYR
jgi:hypothetical protein